MTIGVLLIDCQEKLFPKIHQCDVIRKKLLLLVQACNTLNIPILTFEQYPQGLGKTLPELHTKQSPIEKMEFSCIDEPCLDWIENHDIEEVIIAGIETHVCVYQTALDLLSEGIPTTVLADATGSRNEIDATWALSTLQDEGCEISTVERLLFRQLKTAKHAAFKQVQNLVIACG